MIKRYSIFTSIPDGVKIPDGHTFGDPDPDGEYMMRICKKWREEHGTYEENYPDHCRDVTRADMLEWKDKYAPIDIDTTA